MGDPAEVNQVCDEKIAEALLERPPNNSPQINPRPKLSQELLAAIRADYLTGQYNSTDLSIKYNTPRMAIFQFITRKKHHWRQDCIDSGIQPKKEDKVTFTGVPEYIWDNIKSEFLKGAKPDELELKFGVMANTIKKKALRAGWEMKRTNLVLALTQKPGPITENQMDQFYELSTFFLDSAMKKIRSMIVILNRETTKPEKVQEMIDLFSALQDAVRKLPKEQKEKMGERPSGDIRKPESESKSIADQPAPRLS